MERVRKLRPVRPARSAGRASHLSRAPLRLASRRSIARLACLGLSVSALHVGDVRPASAQPAASDSAPVFVRVLLRRLDRLAQDTLISRRTGAKSGLELLGASRPDALGRIDDADLVALTEVLAESLERADVAACAAIWTKGFAQGFAALGTRMDSSMSERWAVLLERMVLASVLDRPLGRMAPAADFEAEIAQMAFGLSPDEVARIQRAYVQRAAADPEDACFLARRVYGWMAKLPPDRAAAIIRGSMFSAAAAPGGPPE